MFKKAAQYVGIISFALGIMSCASTKAQKSGEQAQQKATQKQGVQKAAQPPQPKQRVRRGGIQNKPRAIYRLALKYKDYQAAINAMYDRIANDPGNIGLRDTLASLYYMTKSYNQCIMVCNDVLSQQPKNTRALNLAAMAFKKVGNNQQALNAYKRLYKVTGSIYHLYESSFLQFQMKDYKGALKTIDQILKDPKAEKQKVTIQISKTTEQTVPIKAAILNLKGAVHQRLENTEKARTFYNQSLEVTKDFMLPQQNLKELKKQ